MSSITPRQDLVDLEPRYIENRDMRGWESTVGRFFNEFVFGQMIPATGSIVELGTGQGVNFVELCRQFGEERCVGYDVVNFLNHPRVKEEDIRKLSSKDDYPIALGFNDLSDWELSPQSKQAGFAFIKRNLVAGGFYIDAAFTSQTPHLIDLSQFTLVAEQDSIKLFQYCGKDAEQGTSLKSPWELSPAFWQWFDRLQLKQEQSLRLRNSSRTPLLTDKHIEQLENWIAQSKTQTLLPAERLLAGWPEFKKTISEFVSGYSPTNHTRSCLNYWISTPSSAAETNHFDGPTFALPMGQGTYEVCIWDRYHTKPAPGQIWELQPTDLLFFPSHSSVHWQSTEPNSALLFIQLDISAWEEAVESGAQALQESTGRLCVDVNYTRLLQESSPALYQSLQRSAPLIDSLTRGFEHSLTIPQELKSNEDSVFERYPEHYRSLTLPLHKLGSGQNSQGVVVLKGSEPLLNDYEALLDWMAQSTFRGPSNFGHSPMLEHFPLHENKIPGALSLREAEEEFRIALEFQNMHLKHYGELAKMPVPIGVHRLDEAASQKVRKCLQERLSSQAMGNIDHLLTEGLGIYLYYYPGSPHRVRTTARAFQSENEGARIERLQSWDPQRIIHRWSSLFARIMHLGYLPYSFHNESLGALFDAGNACMDGGFVDLDSLIAIDQLKTDDAFFDALSGSVLGLIRTVSELLPHYCHGETKDLFVRQYVMNEVSQALIDQAKPSLLLDPRVSKVFRPLAFEDLMSQLKTRQRHTTDFMKLS